MAAFIKSLPAKNENYCLKAYNIGDIEVKRPRRLSHRAEASFLICPLSMEEVQRELNTPSGERNNGGELKTGSSEEGRKPLFFPFPLSACGEGTKGVRPFLTK
jgi:hypothetical protein